MVEEPLTGQQLLLVPGHGALQELVEQQLLWNQAQMHVPEASNAEISGMIIRSASAGAPKVDPGHGRPQSTSTHVASGMTCSNISRQYSSQLLHYRRQAREALQVDAYVYAGVVLQPSSCSTSCCIQHCLPRPLTAFYHPRLGRSSIRQTCNHTKVPQVTLRCYAFQQQLCLIATVRSTQTCCCMAVGRD